MLNPYILALNIVTPSDKTVYCCDTRTSQNYKLTISKLLLLTKCHNEKYYSIFNCTITIFLFSNY